MYIGRIVAVGMNKKGRSVAMYRVSSRSFPNREARLKEKTVSIMPRKGFEDDLSKNPYIAYNCVKPAGKWAVVSNGSHTDPICEKILSGVPVKDSMALTLLSMDYEKDHLDTPRIAAAVNHENNLAFLATVRKNDLSVRAFELTPGEAYYLATYEHAIPSCHYRDENFDVSSAENASKYIINGGIFAEFEKPVCSAAVIREKNDFEFAVQTV